MIIDESQAVGDTGKKKGLRKEIKKKSRKKE